MRPKRSRIKIFLHLSL